MFHYLTLMADAAVLVVAGTLLILLYVLCVRFAVALIRWAITGQLPSVHRRGGGDS